MIKSLTEQKVLKRLDIIDFRHLTKDKVITMASMIDKIDPEVAKKALEQFPEFASTAKEIVSEYKDTLHKCLESNKEITKSYYDSCNSLIETLQKELEKDNHSFEERKYIMDMMYKLSKDIGEKDSENKKFIATMAVIGASVIGGAILGLASVLGGNTKVEESDIDRLT